MRKAGHRGKIIIASVLSAAVMIIAKPPATTRSTNLPPMDDDHINQIRISMLKTSDTEVALRFEHDVLRRYATATNRKWEDFEQEPHIQQAMEILGDPDRSFRADVRVLTDPPEMVEFRYRVLPVLVGGCATKGCHGGTTGAGNFFLSDRLRQEQYVYADFVALRDYVKIVDAQKTSLFAQPDRQYMIDTDNPEHSLLLQYALPIAAGQPPHPDVKDFRAVARNADDVRYKEILQWIEELK